MDAAVDALGGYDPTLANEGGDVCDEDDDGDGIKDDLDNCPRTLGGDADQTDTDDDGLGNVCDSDDDNDGVLDGVDNCRFVSNPNQEDTDPDIGGDACDSSVDLDGDSFSDAEDNCPLIANDQTDGTFYGNGQNIWSSDGHPVYSHSGGWLGFSAYYIRYPEQSLSVVTLCNDADQWPSQYSREVIELYLDQNH